MELITRNNNASNALETQQNFSPSTQEQIAELRNKYPTFQDFCNKFSKQNVSAGAQHPTKCVTCAAPTLTYINLTFGDGNAIAWLIYHLTFFQENVNVPNKMTKYQIETCAQSIFENYHYLKATEIMLFFARLAGGMYPVDWHGYVTPTKIVSALREHFMPWRNDLLYKVEKAEQERKAKEDAKKPVVTYEEWLKMKEEAGEEVINKENPLKQFEAI